MKVLIKKLLREGLLTEKLTNVDADVDMIYDKFFRKDIDRLNKTGIITNELFLYSETYTDILKSPESVEAHKLNPCTIKINYRNNFYTPNSSLIGIGLNDNALSFVKNSFRGNLNNAIDNLDYQDAKRLKLEFTEDKIKGSIHHELAHWIDDTMNNYHITKRVNKAMELGTVNFGGIPVNSTKMEIQAQIHNVKQLHNKYKDVWDNLTFIDMIEKSLPLMAILNSFSENETIRTKWIRDLKTRMYREGLLGKKMVGTE
jgi:hypothetical protein